MATREGAAEGTVQMEREGGGERRRGDQGEPAAGAVVQLGMGRWKTDAAHAIGSVAYQSFVKEASTLLAMTCCVVRLRGHRPAAMQAEPHLS